MRKIRLLGRTTDEVIQGEIDYLPVEGEHLMIYSGMSEWPIGFIEQIVIMEFDKSTNWKINGELYKVMLE